MKSNGGAMLAGAAAAAPIQTVMSGPAGGMTATEHIAAALGESNVLTLDMGGTSADVGILVDGKQRHTTEYEIEWGVPAAVPLIDIKSIGAGGGSIAWVDAGGFLRVGPQSAGAQPGPVCYGRGGDRGDRDRREPRARPARPRLLPRRADAARRRRGAARRSRSTASGSAWARSSSPPRSSRSRTRTWRARSRWCRSSAATTRAGSRCSRSAAPGRSTRPPIARLLDIPRVIVPPYPGVFSALGLLLADIRVDKVWTQAFRSNDVDAALVNRAVRAMIGERAVGELRQEGFAGEPEMRRSINMRYLGQNYEHEVEIDAGRARRRCARALVPALRRAARRSRYGYQIDGRGDRARELQGHARSGRGRHPTSTARSRRSAFPRASREVYLARAAASSTAAVVRRASLDARRVGRTALPSSRRTARPRSSSRACRSSCSEQGALVIDTGTEGPHERADDRPGHADRRRQLPDELLPRHGRHDDDDGVLADLQRVARLLVRDLRPAGQHARAGRVLPVADRHDQVHRRVDDRGARPGRLRGGRRRHPQRPVPRVRPRPGAHAAEAGLLGRRARRLRRERRAHVRGRREDAGRALGRRDRDLPGGAAAAAGQDQAPRRGRRRHLEASSSPTTGRRASRSATSGR